MVVTPLGNYKSTYYEVEGEGLIESDLFQRVYYSELYPAFIAVHREDPPGSVPQHWHPGPELIYTRNRALTIYAGNAEYEVLPGEFILISGYTIHAIRPGDGDSRQDVMSVIFQVDILEKMWPEMRESVLSAQFPGMESEAYDRMTDLCEQLREAIEDAETGDGNAGYFDINRIIYSMLAEMKNNFCSAQEAESNKHRDRRRSMVKMAAYIEQHYRENLTLGDVASHFGYSSEYYSRAFKRFFGTNFSTFLTNFRLDAAAEDLEQTTRRIGDIAAEHGFPSEKSFYTAFKKRYGITPGKYRDRKN